MLKRIIRDIKEENDNLYYGKEKAITLIVLIITIIILLILVGTVISLALGNNGLLNISIKASEENKKASLKEELELEIFDVQIETKAKGEKCTKKEIAEKLNTVGDVSNYTQEMIEGEYKDYEFWVDKDNKVIIGEKLKGEKPKGGAFVYRHSEGEEVQIYVWGEVTNGSVKIECLSGLQESQTNIFTVKENGTYYFKITGNEKRSIIVSCTVNNNIVEQKDLLSSIDKMEDSGIRKIAIKGKIENEQETTEDYFINTIKYKGDLILDGKTQVYGATLENNVYSFGCESDIGLENKDAQSTVVLKVDGNLTINSEATITAINGTYGGPKGMIIYCTGTLTNNGIISMTARGAKAQGQDVYILKNEDGTFEYIPKEGGKGGAKSTNWKARTITSNKGESGIGRQTGGGGSGSAVEADDPGYVVGPAISGAGSEGTSYSGGTGGGSCISWNSAHSLEGLSGEANRRCRRKKCIWK